MMNKLLNILIVLILAAILLIKGPSAVTNFKLQDKPAPMATLKRLSGEEIGFPIPNQKIILVFWATWCGPCKVELNRINRLMAEGKIKSNQLIAINIQENAETVNQFLEKNPLQFLIALDESGKISEKYKVEGTPTVAFLDENGLLNWISSGISPTLEMRIDNFLKN